MSIPIRTDQTTGANQTAARPRAASPGRPKDPAKRTAILEAAKDLFVLHGYEGVSMDQIAAAAGVSKLTLYSHFGDKDALFVESARLYCAQKIPDALFAPAPTIPLRARLLEIATTYLATITSPQAIAGHRLLCSAPMLDKQLSRIFWNSGPMRFQQALAELLEQRMAAGQLHLDDSARAASHFFALLRGEPYMRLIFDCVDPDLRDEQALRQHAESAVDLFLRAHATATRPASPSRR